MSEQVSSGCFGTLKKETMKRKFPKRTPEEIAHSEEIRVRAERRLAELKARDIQRDAERRRRASS